ncbi:MAG TPA: hypothetical protein DEH78_19100 [Solibacterales bacterium]|nr:hypothetical protein [Bryobacterales bacterium]
MLYTCERPWRDNRPGDSCIPVGTYRVEPRRYNRGGYPAYEVTGVSGRSLILIHRGNVPTDIEGCILVGLSVGVLKGQLAVLESRPALEYLLAYFGSEPWELVIEEASAPA